MHLHVVRPSSDSPCCDETSALRNRIASGLEAVAAAVRSDGEMITGFAAVLLLEDGNEVVLHDFAERDMLKVIGGLESLKFELLTTERKR